MSQSVSNVRLAIISQMRVDDMSRIDGNGFSEAVRFSNMLQEVVFVCFNNGQSLNARRINSNLTIYTIPLSITNSIVHTFRNIIRGFLLLVAHLPRILNGHRINLIRGENVILGGIPAAVMNIFMKMPFGLMLLGSEEEVIRIRYGNSLLTKAAVTMVRTLKRLIFRRADFVLTVSRRELMDARSLGTKRTGWTTGFIDTDIFSNRPRAIAIGRMAVLRFLFVGRLEIEKGIRVLLEASSKLDGTENIGVMIAGKGSLLPAVQRACSNHKNISYAGYFSHASMPEILSGADALLLPSFTEGLPAIIMESMLCGIPVIASNVGEIPMLVQAGRTGYLIQPGSPEELTDAIIRMSRNPEQMKQMGQSARTRALALLGNYVEKHIRLYNQILCLH